MKTLKSIRPYILIGAVIIAIISFILLLTSNSFTLTTAGYQKVVLPATLTLFGKDCIVVFQITSGSMILNAIKVKASELFAGGGDIKTPITGILITISFISIVVLSIVNIVKRFTSKHINLIIAGIPVVLSVLYTILVLNNAVDFIKTNEVNVGTDVDYKISGVWIVSIILMILSTLISLGVVFLTEDNKSLPKKEEAVPNNTTDCNPSNEDTSNTNETNVNDDIFSSDSGFTFGD